MGLLTEVFSLESNKKGQIKLLLIVTIFILSFLVSSASSYSKEGDIKSSKDLYNLGDEIILNIGGDDFDSYQLYIENNNERIRYFGEIKGVVSFSSLELGIGKYTVYLFRNNQEIDSTSFIISKIKPISKSTDSLAEDITEEEEIPPSSLAEQQQAEINKPVKWVKVLEGERGFIHKSAENLSVKNQEKLTIKSFSIKEIFSIANKNIDQKEIVFENSDKYIIEYETEAPLVYEKEVSKYNKLVTVSSKEHYNQVYTYTTINEVPKELISVDWISEGDNIEILGLDYFDENGNGLIDKIGWFAPHLSNETFNVTIDILNVQSYPVVGGNWTVNFVTAGSANLSIRAIEDTTWSNDSEDFDLKFLQISCGSSVREYEWKENSVYISNYSCNNVGSEVSKVFTLGKHVLEFNFGGKIAYAYNDASDESYFYAESDGSSATTSTTPINKTVLEFTLVNGGNFTILASAEMSGSSGANSILAQLEIDGSVEAVYNREPDENNIFHHHFKGHKTMNLGPGTHAINLQFYTESGQTNTIRNARIAVLKSRDKFSIENNTEVSVTTTPLNASSLTFTIPSEGNYLVIGSSELTSGSPASSIIGRIIVNDVILSEAIYEGETGSDYHQQLSANVTSLSAGSHTIKIQGVAESGTMNMRRARISVIPADNNFEFYASSNETETTNGATNPLNKSVLTFTPSTTDEYLVMSLAVLGGDASNGAAVNSFTDTRINGNSFSEGQYGYSDDTDRVSLFSIKNISLNGAETSITRRYYSGASAAPDASLSYSRILVIRTLGLDNQAPSPPTNIQCDNDDNCNITVDKSVILNVSGSTDSESNEITYYLEALLQNATIVQNGTNITKIAGGSGGDPNSRTCSDAWGVSCSPTCTTEIDNTYDSCSTCSNTDERIQDVHLSATTVNTGGSIEVTCEYFTTETTADEIYVYYRNSSTSLWVQQASGSSSGTGSTIRNFTTVDITVDNVIGEHQVRCIIDFTGEADECGGGSFYDNDDANFTVIDSAVESNTSYTSYNDLDGVFETVENITVTVEVTSYTPTGSIQRSNNKPDLELEVYNGSELKIIGLFGLNNTYTGSGTNTTARNFSLFTIDPEVLSAWNTATNQDLQIRGKFFDLYDSNNVDEINYTNIEIKINGKKWKEIGNHTESSVFTWNTSGLEPQSGINLRSRAIDLNGSGTYSSYFTKGSYMNISHGFVPTAFELECEENGAENWNQCGSIGFGETVSRVRLRCLDVENNITNVTFNLENIPDTNTFFDNFTVNQSGDYWIFDNEDLVIGDSGNFELTATCTDNTGFSSTNSSLWTVPWGNLNITLIDPNGNTNVTKDKLFNFSTRVSCIGGECSNVNATLDPTDWWNTSWNYRRTITLNETTGFNRRQAAVDLVLNPSSWNVQPLNCSTELRVVDDNNNEIPSQIYNEVNDGNCDSANIVFIANLSAGEIKDYTLYYSNSTLINSPNYTNIITSSDNSDGWVLYTGNISFSYNWTGGRGGGLWRVNMTTPAGEVAASGGNAFDRPDSFESADTFTSFTQTITGPLFREFELVSSVRGTQVMRVYAHQNWFEINNSYSCSSGCTDYMIVGMSGVTSSARIWNDFNSETTNGEYTASDFFFVDDGTNNWGTGIIVSGTVDQPFDSATASDLDLNTLVDGLYVNNDPYTAGYPYWPFTVDDGTTGANRTAALVKTKVNTSLGSEEEFSKGVVSMVIGTNPFYTTSQNPRDHLNSTCLASMSSGNVCNVSWVVNATGSDGTTWEFFVFANSTNYTDLTSIGNSSQKINITIRELDVFAPVLSNITPTNNSDTQNPVILSANTDEASYCQYSTTQTFVYGTGTNFTIGQNSDWHSVSLGNLSDGSHTYYIKCEDLSNNANIDSNQGSTTFRIDNTAPVVALNSPINGETILSSSTTFNWSVTDNLTITSFCNLTVDSTVRASNISVGNGSTSAFTVNGLATGSHLWNVTCSDNAGNVDTSSTNSFTTVVSTTLKQIIKGSGVTSGDSTDIVFSPSLTNTSKAFHFVSYRNSGIEDHANIFKSSEIINNNTLRIYGDNSGGSVAVNFEYTIIEFTEDSPILVQRGNITIPSGTPTPLNSSFNTQVNLSQSFLINQGHSHNAGETTTGVEELDRLRLVNSTTLELTIGSTINSGPQHNRYEVIDWNDAGFVSVVQRGIADLGSASSSTSVNPPLTVNPNRTLLFISAYESANTAFSEPPSEIGLYATLTSSGNIDVQRVSSSGPNLSIAWELVEFKAGVVKVQHTEIHTAASTSSNSTLIEAVNTDRSAVIGTVSIPFGHSGARSTDTTNGAVGRMMFSVNLTSSTTIEGVRGDSTGTAAMGVQVIEFLTGPTITNVNATNISSSNTTIVWNTDATANSTVKYGTNPSILSLNKSSTIFVSDHLIVLESLISNTTYYYNVSSCSAIGCSEEGPFNFTTLIGGVAATAPLVNLSSPINGTWVNIANITLYYNASDVNNDITNSTLILNGQINQTNQSEIINGGTSNFTLVNLGSGVYNWNVNVTDIAGLSGTDELRRTFYIDTVESEISLQAPSESLGIFKDWVEFNFTAFDNLDPVLSCNLTIDSVVVDQNVISPNGTLINRTINGISTGFHLWNVTCSDEAGNFNVSSTRNFTILDLVPNVTLSSPSNGTWLNFSLVNFYYNTSDNNGLIKGDLYLNGLLNQTNQSEIINDGTNNFSLVLIDGLYNWTVNVTDTNNLTGKADEWLFYVDTNKPLVNLNSPPDSETTELAIVDFNFTAFDNLDPVLSCNLTIDSVVRDISFSANNGSLTNREISNITDGSHLWNVTCSDEAGNFNVSSTRNLFVNETPKVNLDTLNNTWFNVSTISLEYTPTDNTGFSNCSLFINGAFNSTNQSEVTNFGDNNFSLTLNQGYYNWSVSCVDTANLINNSIIKYFQIDTQIPSIELQAPDEGSSIFASTITFNFTAVDNLDPVLSCNLTIDSVVRSSNLNASNGTQFNATVSSITGGFHLWNVTCSDEAGNFNVSSTRNFTIEDSPSVNLVVPVNETWLNSSEVFFEYTASDANENIANASLKINGVINLTNQTNVETEGNNNFTVNLTDGLYNWTVNVTDITGLSGEADEWLFYVDTHFPTINLNYPQNSTIVNWNNVSFNFTAFDNLDPVLSCNISLNSTVEFSNLNSTSGIDVIRHKVIQDGNYTWNVACFDESNNLNNTVIFNFTVESPPNVTLGFPDNNYRTNLSTIIFTYTPSDAIGLTNCSLFIDGNQTSFTTEPDNNLENQFLINNIAEGRHNWTVQCIDAAPDYNYFNATQRNFTIDNSPPFIILNSPQNSTIFDYNYNNITFNFTAIDLLDGDLTCNLIIDSEVNLSEISVLSGIDVINGIRMDLGTHLWNVSCFDGLNNTNTSSTFEFNVTRPDLAIQSSDISFNDTAPIENQTILINAIIRNEADVAAQNITVQFFNGDPDFSGVQINGNITLGIIPARESLSANISLDSPLGSSSIFVIVDPPISGNGSINELNETNNKAYLNLSVSGWEFVYGEILSDSELRLQDSSNSTVISWDALSSTILYVSDLESVIEFGSLLALGKNSTGFNSSQDFLELDQLLNMSSFNDSISNLYTVNQIPKEVTSIFIFRDNITQIPIANSYNNSNFTTGILWDSSDDLDGEFDVSEAEDIVFVTKTNFDTQGSFGIYDYEIRIPANLRKYKGGEIESVAFYTEIK